MKTRNIAIFLDGTWNQVESYTNVYLLYQMCQGAEINCDSGKQNWEKTELLNEAPQLRYYDSGVGTGLHNFSPVLLGGVLGIGLRRNVAQAYLTICRHYQEGDNIFIYGFSRGAYTARTLGGLLSTFGILKKEYCKPYSFSFFNPSRVMADFLELRFAKKAVNRIRKLRGLEAQSPARKESIKQFRNRYCLPMTSENGLSVKMMGVFDTVGALGIPSLIDPLGKKLKNRFLNRNRMPNSEFPENIEFGRHALAIDEFRPHFRPTLWTDTDDNDVEQRWFVGAHSNIGGGYEDNLLSNKPLKWMYDHSIACGLKMSEFRFPHQNVHMEEPITDSFAAFRLIYRVFGFSEYFRKIALSEDSLKSQSLDASVIERFNYDNEYRSESLVGLSRDLFVELQQNQLKFDRELERKLAG